MATSIDELKSQLNELDYNFVEHDESTLVLDFKTKTYRDPDGDPMVTLVIQLPEEGEHFYAFTPRPIFVSEQPDALIRVCLLIQLREKLIKFDFDEEEGALRLVVEFPLEDSNLTVTQLQRCLRQMIHVIDKYYQVLNRAAKKGVVDFSEEEDVDGDSVEDVDSGTPLEIEEGISYLDSDTDPPYPGEFYFLTKPYEDTVLRMKSFPSLSRISELFRKFSVSEVDAICRKIQSTETLPILVFVREILSEKFHYLPAGADAEDDSNYAPIEELKPPFWFLPFGISGGKIGGVVYLEQNGYYTNMMRPFLLSCFFPSDKIQDHEVTAGIGTESVNGCSTLKISNYDDEVNLELNEFHGDDFDAQLRVFDACWAIWRKVVDENRDGPIFVLNSVNFREFSSWDEVLSWAQEEEEVNQVVQGPDIDETNQLAANEDQPSNISQSEQSLQAVDLPSGGKDTLSINHEENGENIQSDMDQIEYFRDFVSSRVDGIKLLKGRPYGILSLGNGYEIIFHVRRDNVNVFFISNKANPNKVFQWIQEKGLMGKDLGGGHVITPMPGKRNPNVVRVELAIPIKSHDDLFTDETKDKTIELFNTLKDTLGDIAKEPIN